VARRLGIAVVFTLAADPHTVLEARQRAGQLDRRTFATADITEHLWFRTRLVEDLAADADHLVVFPRAKVTQEIGALTGVDLSSGRRPWSVVPEGVSVRSITATAETLAAVADGAPVPPVIAEALTAGVPVVALPFSTDQFAIAADLERTGLGVAGSPNELRPPEVTSLVEAALTTCASLAAALGESLRAKPGPRQAWAAVNGARPDVPSRPGWRRSSRFIWPPPRPWLGLISFVQVVRSSLFRAVGRDGFVAYEAARDVRRRRRTSRAAAPLTGIEGRCPPLNRVAGMRENLVDATASHHLTAQEQGQQPIAHLSYSDRPPAQIPARRRPLWRLAALPAPAGMVLDDRIGGGKEHALVAIAPADPIRRRAILAVHL
jgi:hypothetical protein